MHVGRIKKNRNYAMKCLKATAPHYNYEGAHYKSRNISLIVEAALRAPDQIVPSMNDTFF